MSAPRLQPTQVDAICRFITERHRIHERRQARQPKPWTKDPILQNFRFTNVYREHDTVTTWIRENWRHEGRQHVWFAMCVARLVNWAPSLAEIGYPVPWNPAKFTAALARRKLAGEKVFTGAYVINQSARVDESSVEKHEYLAKYVLTPLWEGRETLDPAAMAVSLGRAPTLAEYHKELTQYIGMGSFMAAQVIADLKYVKPLLRAVDWHTWAAPGPGSARGLNIVCGRATDDRWVGDDWHRVLLELRELVNGRDLLPTPLHAQDLQNCLCEFSKYTRGSSRSKYPGV